MELIDFSNSPLSLLPPAIALFLAIITRRVLISLGIGIVVGALLLNDYSLFSATSYISSKVSSLVIDGGEINSWNMSIVAFLLLLGAMTALLSLSGGTRAFAAWAQTRIKGKKGAQLLASLLGVLIFVDDYFNSLAVGSIAKPVTDRFGVSRAKLAYILDSTAAPMCVVMPASSWGAYIMTIIAGIVTSHGITEYTPLGVYVALIPLNFYAIFALLMVFAVVMFNLNVGPMARAEVDVHGSDSSDNVQNEWGIKESETGSVADLVLPIIILVIATCASMIYTGAASLSESGTPFSLLGAFENTSVDKSLVWGGLVGLAAALVANLRQGLALSRIARATFAGAWSMSGAILILFFAWTIGGLIGDIKTGAYLSSLVEGNIDANWLPVILFILSGVMAFATGTSWGTFGIMLPIAGDMAAATDIQLMLPVLGAVLAGSVFGDHCSPISDTTILSSTGAGCKHIDHVSTQLPYAVTVALVSCIGYIVLGATESTSIAFGAASLTFVFACFGLSRLSQSGRAQIVNA